MLLRDRPDEALAAFERSDDMWPDCYITLLCTVRAAEPAGDPNAGADWSDRLLEIPPGAVPDSIDRTKALALRDRAAHSSRWTPWLPEDRMAF